MYHGIKVLSVNVHCSSTVNPPVLNMYVHIVFLCLFSTIYGPSVIGFAVRLDRLDHLLSEQNNLILQLNEESKARTQFRKITTTWRESRRQNE